MRWTDEVKVSVREKDRWKQYLITHTQEDYNRYEEQRTVAKNKVLEAKNYSWQEFGKFMKDNFKGNQKLFFKVLKGMRKDKECPLKFIRDENGVLLTEEKEVMSRWKRYFETLLSGEVEDVIIAEEGENRRTK